MEDPLLLVSATLFGFFAFARASAMRNADASETTGKPDHKQTRTNSR
jgi:hypothetical protein